MVAEDEALVAVDATASSAVPMSTVPSGEPHRDLDGWSTWDEGGASNNNAHVASPEATRSRRDRAVSNWLEMQMQVDRAVAALAEYEFPD